MQIEYSLVSRGPEATILPAARELGMGITAYGVLSRRLFPVRPSLRQRTFAVTCRDFAEITIKKIKHS